MRSALDFNFHPLKFQMPLNLRAKWLAISLLNVLYYFMQMPLCPSLQVYWNPEFCPCGLSSDLLTDNRRLVQNDISSASFASFQLLSSTEPEFSLLISRPEMHPYLSSPSWSTCSSGWCSVLPYWIADSSRSVWIDSLWRRQLGKKLPWTYFPASLRCE